MLAHRKAAEQISFFLPKLYLSVLLLNAFHFCYYLIFSTYRRMDWRARARTHARTHSYWCVSVILPLSFLGELWVINLEGHLLPCAEMANLSVSYEMSRGQCR